MASRISNSTAVPRSNTKSVAVAKSIKPVNKILASFTKRELEALSEFYRKKFSIVGRSSSSKSISLISDMHVGSQYAVYSGTNVGKINPDQERLLEWWKHCSDSTGKTNLLLLAGEPIDGSNPKSNSSGTWSPDINLQLEDSEKLIRMWHYDKFALCRGSRYHVEEKATRQDKLRSNVRSKGITRTETTQTKG